MSEKEQVEKIAEQKPKRKSKKKWTPRNFAIYLLLKDSGLVLLNAMRLKEKLELRMTPEKIERLKSDPEFIEEIRLWMPKSTKERVGKMFDVTLEHYYEGQLMMFERGEVPHAKALIIFGQYSGKYDPTQKVEVSGLGTLTPEKEEYIKRQYAKSVENRLQRLKDEDNGGGNGK